MEYNFDPSSAYVAAYTEKTVQKMKEKRKGRCRVRYNIIRLSRSEDVVVIADITYNQLQEYRTQAEAQGTKIW